MQAPDSSSIPEAIINPELEQLQGRDEAKLALLWHVQVINEGNEVLPTSWPKDALQKQKPML